MNALNAQLPAQKAPILASDLSATPRPATVSFLKFLVEAGHMTLTVAERLERVQNDTGDRLAHLVLKTGLLSEALLASRLAEFTQLNLVESGRWPTASIDLPELNMSFWRAHEMLPIALTEQTLSVACWDALDEETPQTLAFSLDCTVKRVVATRSDVLRALDRLYPISENSADLADGKTSAVEEEEVDRMKDLASDAPVIRLVQRLIAGAVTARASDIHLEPTDRGLVVRYRLDGLLKETAAFQPELASSVVSRIKVMSGLNIAERRLPQDGRIRVSIEGKDVDFRVSTSPTLFGESVVLRILDRHELTLNFDALGFNSTATAVLREAIANPYGIFLVTGPTGSGKTTTLYAALKEINTPDKKILTVEDPVEYTLSGVNQVPIRPQIGLTFAHALRAFLRQDPDVMMVGEIRDRETAEIAVQAALTGHMLLSTLHTNSASAAITRLLDMGIDGFLLTSTLSVIVGQRLLRRLCPDCRCPYVPSESVLGRFGLSTGQSMVWHRASGCAACQHTGYRGRTSIVEILRMTDALRAQVLAGADAHALEATAVKEGMETLLQHGLRRIGSGETTLEEVLRVTRLS